MKSIVRYLPMLLILIVQGNLFGQSGFRSQKQLVNTVKLTVGNDRSVKSVAPLLHSVWSQGCFYNTSCPTDTASHASCLHTPAGAGAIAMAQILKYYAYPAHGIGEHGYQHPKYGVQYANFGAANYNWSGMPDSLTSANTDVATIIYHCGVAQNMNYGSTTSTSLEADLDTALIKYFGYPKIAVWKERASYTATEWQNMLKAELDAAHPVLYSGFNFNGTRQHFFVCDGYQGSDSFHINWGFESNLNGYFSLDNLTLDTTDFSYSQRAIFGLTPSPPTPTGYKMDFENVADFSLTFNDWTVQDVDKQDTYSIDGYSFPHQNEPMAFLCFNPALVTPSMASDPAIQPHGGQRFGACFSSNPPANNDWFISPQVQLGVNGSFLFWIKSYSATWGLDSYKVAVSITDNNPSSFTVISGANPLQTTINWTRMAFNLAAYNNQKVYVAIQCVSNDHFLMMIDDLEIKPDASSMLTADFSADKTTVRVGEPVNFSDQSSGLPASWIWSFTGGSPNSAIIQNPGNIRYATPGVYSVKLKVSNNVSSDSLTKISFITVTGYPSSMSLDFESLADFTMTFTPWTLTDAGGGDTYGIQGVTFPNNYLPMAYICFNPATTNPPLVNMTAHSGQKLGCSFSTTPPLNPNNKWLISPKMSLGVDPQIEFWARTYNNTWGDEKYRVAVSNTDINPVSFIPLIVEPEVAPSVWTRKTYNLTNYANQDVYIGIQCVTDNGFIFMIDDISITSTVGIGPLENNSRFSVFPNPASDFIRIKSQVNLHSAIKVELISLPGTFIKTWQIFADQEIPALDVRDIPQGFYVLKISGDGTISEYKISVIH